MKPPKPSDKKHAGLMPPKPAKDKPGLSPPKPKMGGKKMSKDGKGGY